MRTKSNPFNHVGFLCPSGTIHPKLSLVTFPKLQSERKPRLKTIEISRISSVW